MKSNLRVVTILGIPIEINASWLITMAFVMSLLALRFYPEVLPESRQDDYVLHWAMAAGSGAVFFASILLHELAHSIMAKRQGIEVKSITLFIFGGVSQIAADARRPLHEFLIAIVGPLTSALLAVVFLAFWAVTGFSDTSPLALVLQWLFIMNIVVAVFNMAPGFPMDGGRVLRALIWGVSGNLYRATRLATFVGRAMGFTLVFVGAMALFGLLDFIDTFSGLWFVLLGFYLESSSRQSWLQARALNFLSEYKAADIMSSDLRTAYRSDLVRYLRQRASRYFIFFVTEEEEEHVVGVLTEREVNAVLEPLRDENAGDLMIPTGAAATALMDEDGASMLQQMEAAGVWHLPILEGGRVVGVVSKESLLRLLAQRLFRPAQLNTS